MYNHDMTKEAQVTTKATYSDPEIVAGYVEANAKNPKLSEVVAEFARTIGGKRVVDIGCGPGHDSYQFAKLGFDVTGLDYSPEMIKTAKTLEQVAKPPQFAVADMREVGNMYPDNSFDAAWISASMLHIPEEDVPTVLRGVHKVVVNNGKVYIGLKGGEQGAQLVTEQKYSKPMQREFIFWERDNFEKLVTDEGFIVDNVTETDGGMTGDKPTSWLNFFLTVQK